MMAGPESLETVANRRWWPFESDFLPEMNRKNPESESDSGAFFRNFQKIKKKCKNKKLRNYRALISVWGFGKNFFEIVFEKALDFLGVYTHTMQAFKLRLNKSLRPNP